MLKMLTLERLKELLYYDQKTGDFTWLVRPSIRSRRRAGDVAGCLKDNGYVVIVICGISYRAHRLAWFYMTGVWPTFEIDHKNTIKNDNHWKNLRDETHSVNMQNRHKAQRNNSTGVRGVTPHGKGFRAMIWFNKKNHCLGTYPTPELAYEVRLKATRELHPGCTL